VSDTRERAHPLRSISAAPRRPRKVRALETLVAAAHRRSRGSSTSSAQCLQRAKSASVQRAIAEVFLAIGNAKALPKQELAALAQRRQPASGDDDS
jgi:hypothetical protein